MATLLNTFQGDCRNHLRILLTGVHQTNNGKCGIVDSEGVAINVAIPLAVVRAGVGEAHVVETVYRAGLRGENLNRGSRGPP